ncbi:unnamed protein product, partial [Prunus brigantina]
FLTSIPPGVPKVLRAQISRPGAPGRGDVREHVTSFFRIRCGCALACQHGGAPARCSESDLHKSIYGLKQASRRIVLRRLEKSRVV